MDIANRQVRVSDAKAQRILEMIEDGSIKIGDKLPGQRELAIQLGIGRSSLREATRHLEVIGVLETRPGLGTYVISDKPKTLVTPLDKWLAEHKDEVYKVFEVREALEAKAAELATKRATREDIDEIKNVLEKMEEAIKKGDIVEATEQDLSFHTLLSQASNNDLLVQIIYGIQGALKKSRQAVLALPGRANRSLAEHKKILKAITNSDPEAAKLAMEEHLQVAVGEIGHLDKLLGLSIAEGGDSI